MAAITPILEETAGTIPFTVIECRGVDIILPLKLGFEASELDTLRFLRLALGLCDFADHA